MEWTESIKRTIDYVEDHLLDTICMEDLSREVGISVFYLQKGFNLMTDFSIAEYIRNRRLYLAALDIIKGEDKVIDIAFKYGYETPESFTKAFVRFHGKPPRDLRKNPSLLKIFLPLKIKVIIQGGSNMDYTIEKMEGFKLIGFAKDFSYDTSYLEIPKFINEFVENYCSTPFAGATEKEDAKRVVFNCRVGEFGVCVDDIGKEGQFQYLIAGHYKGDDVPSGMTVLDVPEMTWAKFTCRGGLPTALQSVNTKIFSEWLPGNKEYEIAMGMNLEWYSDQDMDDPNYESAIWIPVKNK